MDTDEEAALLTSTQAASLLHCSAKTVTRMALSGSLPVAHRMTGPKGAFLFHRADVVAKAAEVSGAPA